MPVLEIIHASDQSANRELKQQFVREATHIFHEVLDTPDGRLRIFFYTLDVEDSNAGSLPGNPKTQEDGS